MIALIQWETAPHTPASSGQIADVNGHRLYAKRAGKGARSFVGSIDGVPVPGAWDTLYAAMGAVAKEARRRGLVS